MAHITDSKGYYQLVNINFIETKQKQLQQDGFGNEDRLVYWAWGYNKSVLIKERMLTEKAERQGLSLRRLIYMSRILAQQREVKQDIKLKLPDMLYNT